MVFEYNFGRNRKIKETSDGKLANGHGGSKTQYTISEHVRFDLVYWENCDHDFRQICYHEGNWDT